MSVFRLRKVFVARATTAEPSGGGHGFGSATLHVTGFLPATRSSIGVGSVDEGAVAR